MALLFSLIFVYTSEEVFEASHTHWCPLFICIPFLTHLVLVWTLQTICFLLFCIALMSHRCKIWVTAYFLSMGAFFFFSAVLCIMSCLVRIFACDPTKRAFHYIFFTIATDLWDLFTYSALCLYAFLCFSLDFHAFLVSPSEILLWLFSLRSLFGCELVH